MMRKGLAFLGVFLADFIESSLFWSFLDFFVDLSSLVLAEPVSVVVSEASSSFFVSASSSSSRETSLTKASMSSSSVSAKSSASGSSAGDSIAAAMSLVLTGISLEPLESSGFSGSSVLIFSDSSVSVSSAGVPLSIASATSSTVILVFLVLEVSSIGVSSIMASSTVILTDLVDFDFLFAIKTPVNVSIITYIMWIVVIFSISIMPRAWDLDFLRFGI